MPSLRKRPVIDALLVRSLLSYDPITDHLTWRKLTRNHRPGPVGVVTDRGYIRVGIQGRLYPAHHLAWAHTYGQWPTRQIDHINQDKGDNRIENLREVDGYQNCQNVGLTKRNTSGFRGVCRVQNKWRAMISYGGSDKKRGRKDVFLGMFDDIDAAARAYAAAAAKFHSHNPAAAAA